MESVMDERENKATFTRRVLFIKLSVTIFCTIIVLSHSKRQSYPCAYLIKHYAMKAYGGVDT
jgi:hypothetical protein